MPSYPVNNFLAPLNARGTGGATATCQIIVPAGSFWKGVCSIQGNIVSGSVLTGVLTDGSANIYAFTPCVVDVVAGAITAATCLPEITLGPGTWNFGTSGTVSSGSIAAMTGALYVRP